MKRIFWLLLACIILLQNGCTIGPPIEETTRNQLNTDREARQSDAFARSLSQ